MNARRFEELLACSRNDLRALTAAADDVKLATALEDVVHLFGIVETGTQAAPRKVVRWELAVERLREWMAGASSTWGGGGVAGGEISDPTGRAADARIENQWRAASEAEGQLGLLFDSVVVLVTRLTSLVKTGQDAYAADHRVVVVKSAATMRRIVAVATVPLDLSQIPGEDDLPGCRSCARKSGKPPKQIGGHFNPVADPNPHGAKRWGKALAESVEALPLCTFCRGHAVAAAQAAGAAEVTSKHYPPVKACDVLHRDGSESAAGRWLAKREKVKT